MEKMYLNGFWSVDFGVSVQNAKAHLLNKHENLIIDDENSNDEILCIDNAQFAGRQTSLILIQFINNQFCKSAVYFKPKIDAFIIDDYKKIKNDINSKYFITELDFELYYPPYEKDDGYTESAISLGKATFSSYWKFTKDNEGFENIIALKITEDLEIVLTYENGKLAKQLYDQHQQKNREDY